MEAFRGRYGAARLLGEYPEAVRTQLLDLMFTPGVGASWQMLKPHASWPVKAM